CSGRQTTRFLHIPEYGNEGCPLIDERYDCLWLNSAVLERVDNGLLDFHRSATSRANIARIRNRDIAVGVDSLIRNINEIARPNPRFGRDEQPAGACFKNRYTDDVSDAETNGARWTPIGKRGSEPRFNLR